MKIRSSKRICLSIAIVCLIFLAFTQAAVASVITVDDNADEDYISIQAAVNNAIDGDTIVVYPGTYVENVKVNKSVTLITGNPDDTIVQAANSDDDVFYATADNVNISGFTITGAHQDHPPRSAEMYNLDYSIAGIYLDGVKGCTVTNNMLPDNVCGIIVDNSSNNILSVNTASNNQCGIAILDSINSTLNNNIISKNTEGVSLYSSSNNTLTNNTIESNNWLGIGLTSSSNNALNNNNVLFSGEGIFLRQSSNNVLNNNTASNNWQGIDLAGSDNNSLINNNALKNNEHGILLQSFSKNNTLIDNTITSNARLGIYLSGSSNNLIYNNHFNNAANARVANSSNNIWSITKTSDTNIIGGYFLGGNYWANPNGTGFSQTCIDANTDGICDSPYSIDENNIDYLPLSLKTSEASAVRVFSKSIVEPGEHFTVQITASNYGLIGRLEETIPSGFTFVDSTLPEWQIRVEGEKIDIPLLIGDPSFEYTLAAPITEGTYSFDGVIKDEDRNVYLVTGDSLVSVVFQPMTYDINNNEAIEKDEIFGAIKDYFDNKITKDDVFEVIKAYFNS